MSQPLFEHYQQLCRQSGVFVESVAPEGRRQGMSSWRLHPAFGRGWMEIAQIGQDMALGRTAHAFRMPCRRTYSDLPESLGISIMLGGRVHVEAPGTGPLTVGGGTVCLWNRGPEAGRLTYDLRAGDGMQGVSIDIPQAVVRELRAEGDDALAGLLARPDPLYARLGRQSGLAAAQILLRAPAGSVVERLRLESAVLALLADLFGGELASVAHGPGALPRRHRAAVDDAVGILRAEFAEPHTIASLAQRVGLNQCYLKTAFRTLTGTTIARYLRDLRMQHARALIEDGRHSVYEAALFVGYSNPSHFAAAFRRTHGLPPSHLRRAFPCGPTVL